MKLRTLAFVALLMLTGAFGAGQAACAGWTPIAHGAAGSTNGGTSVSVTINATNADIIIAGVAFCADTACTSTHQAPTDNQGNTYALAKQDQAAATDAHAGIWYASAATGAFRTSSALTVTSTSLTGLTYPALFVQAFSGSASTSPLDQTNASGSVNATLSVQPGSVTPGVANELVVSMLALDGTATSDAINSGFTSPDYVSLVSTQTYAGSMGYLAPDTAAVNPIWSWTPTSINSDAVIVTFKPAPSACDQTLARKINNPTTTALPREVVLYDPAVVCALTPGSGPGYQVLNSGQLAFQLSGLAAGASQNISINQVLAGNFPYNRALVYSSTTNTMTIDNEYYTIVLNKTQNLTSPTGAVASITPKTGNLGITPTWMVTAANGFSYMLPMTNYTFQILEQGPLIFKAKMTYNFTATEYDVGSTVVWPAEPNGTGYASETVELRAGVNHVGFEEESNNQWISRFTIANLPANEQLYRGHVASNLADGYTIHSGVARVYNECCQPTYNPWADATRDVVGGHSTGPLYYGDTNNNPPNDPWNGWTLNGGWFQVMYDKNNTNTNWIALLSGQASKMLGPTGVTGVNFDTTDPFNISYTGSGYNGVATVATTGGHLRYDWNLMTGTGQPTTVAQVDQYGAEYNPTSPAALLELDRTVWQPLTRQLTWTPDTTTETFSSTLGQLTPTQQSYLFNKLQTDSTFLNLLCSKDGTNCSTFQYIAQRTPAQSLALHDNIVATLNDMLDQYWNHNGYMDDRYWYIRGEETLTRLDPNVQFLGTDPNLTTAQKAEIYADFVYWGNLLQSQDFAPLNALPNQFNYGTTNMAPDYKAGTALTVIPLQNNPEIRAATNLPPVFNFLFSGTFIDDQGASSSSPHYSRGVENTADLCQTAQVAGIYDCTSQQTKLAKTAQFQMDLMTPPDIRFSATERKQVALDGDGPVEASEIFGELGTIFEPSNAALSKQLMAAWDAEGNQYASFYGIGALKVDQQALRAPLALGDAYYPGYTSVLRSGFGTANESAVWFLHGNTYFDHRGGSAGQVGAYLLGAPITLSPSCYFNCHGPSGDPENIAADGWSTHGGLLMAADAASQGWNGTGNIPTLGLYNLTQTSPNSQAMVTDSSSASLTGNQPTVTATYGNGFWTRKTFLNRAVTATPVLVIQDSYPGGNTAAKYMMQPFYASGVVSTPAGNITPTVPTCDLSGNGTCGTEPTNQGSHPLASGWNTFGFIGQWGVDFKVLVYASDAVSNFQLGGWINNWQDTLEYNEFFAKNGVNYTEVQYQLRLLTSTASKMVIVPYPHNGTVPTITTNGTVSITVNGNVITL